MRTLRGGLVSGRAGPFTAALAAVALAGCLRAAAPPIGMTGPGWPVQPAFQVSMLPDATNNTSVLQIDPWPAAYGLRIEGVALPAGGAGFSLAIGDCSKVRDRAAGAVRSSGRACSIPINEARNETQGWLIFIAPGYNATSPIDQEAPLWGPWIFSPAPHHEANRSLFLSAPATWALSGEERTNLTVRITTSMPYQRVGLTAIVLSRGGNGVLPLASFNGTFAAGNRTLRVNSTELFPGGTVPQDSWNTTGTLVCVATVQGGTENRMPIAWARTTLAFHRRGPS